MTKKSHAGIQDGSYEDEQVGEEVTVGLLTRMCLVTTHDWKESGLGQRGRSHRQEGGYLVAADWIRFGSYCDLCLNSVPVD